MKTWKLKFFVCRSRKSGRFSQKRRCGAYRRTKVRAVKLGKLF